MIYTFLPEATEVCVKYDIVPRVFYEIDGITVWSIDVPDDHAMTKDPDFMACVLKGMMLAPAIVFRRIAPPVFIPKIGKAYVATLDKEGNRAIPMARTKSTIEFMFRKPKDIDDWEPANLRTVPEIRSALSHAAEDGIDRIIYFVADKISETIPIKLALEVLEGKNHDQRERDQARRTRADEEGAPRRSTY